MPRKWVVTDQAKLSTIQWSGAYLCEMGNNWGASSFYRSGNKKRLSTFFSNEMYYTSKSLQKVAWKVEKNNGIEMVSVSTVGDKYMQTNLNGVTDTAYGTEMDDFYFEDPETVDSKPFEFDSLVVSYSSNDRSSSIQNREWVAVGIVHSLLIVKHSGVEKLKSIRRYYERYRSPFVLFRHK